MKIEEKDYGKATKWERRRMKQRFIREYCNNFYDRRHRSTKEAEARMAWDKRVGEFKREGG